MRFTESLGKNRNFQNVYRNGKSLANRSLVMYVRKNSEDGNRLGISVSKKVGNSVVRHRLTRLIRESYRRNEERIVTGYDIVVIARAAAKGAVYREMEGAVLHLLKLHHILKVDAEGSEKNSNEIIR